MANATWRIYENLKVTYHHPAAQGGKVQDCGQGEGARADTLAWTVEQANPGDLICTPNGLLFVQGQGPGLDGLEIVH